ncbi:MAG: hypothetical protein KAR32_02605 [Candidatus Omnitrophica bacterium]|nr:hypothetical protein [Candidatus Omnitrophota bacterium]
MIKVALDTELTKIVDISKAFGADRVLLFGSCLDDVARARDIDIAVSGIPPRKFFEYYAEVSMAVKDEVDIVDLDDLGDHFSGRILSKGKVLYEG